MIGLAMITGAVYAAIVLLTFTIVYVVWGRDQW